MPGTLSHRGLVTTAAPDKHFSRMKQQLKVQSHSRQQSHLAASPHMPAEQPLYQAVAPTMYQQQSRHKSGQARADAPGRLTAQPPSTIPVQPTQPPDMKDFAPSRPTQCTAAAINMLHPLRCGITAQLCPGKLQQDTGMLLCAPPRRQHQQADTLPPPVPSTLPATAPRHSAAAQPYAAQLCACSVCSACSAACLALRSICSSASSEARCISSCCTRRCRAADVLSSAACRGRAGGCKVEGGGRVSGVVAGWLPSTGTAACHAGSTAVSGCT
jgi:hypothetical protein